MRVAAGLAFAVYLIAGIAVHGDYGVSWDEEINRDVGRRTIAYVAARVSGNDVNWREMSKGLVAEFGPFFESLLYSVETGLSLDDSADVYRTRHLVTFLAFWLGTVCFHGLLRARFADPRLAFAGTALLVLSPRLFAHSFYNSKDAVLAALFMAGMFTMLRFVRAPSLPWAVAHAAVAAAAVSIRIPSLLLPAVTLGLLALGAWRAPPGTRRTVRTAALAASFLVLLGAFVALFWPQLQEAPGELLLRSLRGAAAGAKQGANSFALYRGDFVPVDSLPWHYVPVWMSITVPPVVLALFAAGLGASASGLVRRPLASQENAESLAFLALFFVPVAGVIAMRPVQYDEWRHLYFVYPSMIVIATTGLAALLAQPRLRRAAIAVAAAGIAHGLLAVVHYHPYQNVYFNVLAGRDVESRFELDYWGLSFREGLEHLLASNPTGSVRVSVSDYPGRLAARILPREQRERLRFGPVAEADWFLSNHRQPGHFECFRTRSHPCVHEEYAVRRGGETLLAVYDVRKAP